MLLFVNILFKYYPFRTYSSLNVNKNVLGIYYKMLFYT